MDFKAKEEHPQLNWFIALTLYYLDKNRRKCSTDLYKAFLWSELEVLRRSNKSNDDMVILGFPHPVLGLHKVPSTGTRLARSTNWSFGTRWTTRYLVSSGIRRTPGTK